MFLWLLRLYKPEKGREEGRTLKFDMSKAYDRVEWMCLEKIMEKLEFDSR